MHYSEDEFDNQNNTLLTFLFSSYQSLLKSNTKVCHVNKSLLEQVNFESP